MKELSAKISKEPLVCKMWENVRPYSRGFTLCVLGSMQNM